MTLSEIKTHLATLKEIAFQLPDKSLVPRHFHVTEIGTTQKQFIDCGGTLRKEEKINFQLWEANDYDHRLHPEKLIHIIELSEKTLALKDLEIEVEYQGKTTINTFTLDFDGIHFLLKPKTTTCLAQDQCNISQPKKKVKLSELPNTCPPGSGCC
ncbi:DUF6428 family protein [Zhouia sp. PK063]|uniref:DUF6428 family protein n=1 Tax=Zhouia sp. PK063 TaxID=3373602 RepID=UPI003794F88E